MAIIQATETCPTTDRQRILLINPAVFDTRYHWSQWHQPSLLLRLSTLHKSYKADVKLLDTLFDPNNPNTKKPRKKRIRFVELDGIKVPIWRFGILRSSVQSQLRQLRRDKWYPDQVYIECFTSFWWEGAAEAAELVRQFFPDTCITLIGSYPTIASEHADNLPGVNETLAGTWDALRSLPADLSVYAKLPSFLYLDTSRGKRNEAEVLAEIEAATKLGIQHFAFIEHGIPGSPQYFADLLESIAKIEAKLSFHVLGNLSPRELLSAPNLPLLMRKAHFVEIVFSDDREYAHDAEERTMALDEHAQVMDLLHAAGFRKRTGEVSASISILGPHEGIVETARHITKMAHVVGSVIMWPYQPTPNECLHLGLDLEMQNGKLFPLRSLNNITYKECLHLLSLGTVVNSKYRARTFDFLGPSLVAKLFRESMRREGWDPHPDIKGTLQLPLRVIHEEQLSDTH